MTIQLISAHRKRFSERTGPNVGNPCPRIPRVRMRALLPSAVWSRQCLIWEGYLVTLLGCFLRCSYAHSHSYCRSKRNFCKLPGNSKGFNMEFCLLQGYIPNLNPWYSVIQDSTHVQDTDCIQDGDNGGKLAGWPAQWPPRPRTSAMSWPTATSTPLMNS